MKRTYAYAAASIICWSTLATVSKLLLGSMNSYQVLMFSAGFATLALLIFNIASGKLRALLKYRPSDYLISLLISLPGTFLYYVFLYSGTARMAASQAFIINYLWPIMSVVFACIILRERLTVRKGVAIGLSFIGVMTVAGGELLCFNSQTLIGALLCVLAAVSYGAFCALNRKWQYDEQITMMLSFFAVLILTGIINLISGGIPSIGIAELFGFAWNGIFVMALATVTWALALKYGGTAKVSNLAYITPFLSLIWTYFILDEPIEPLSVCGLLIIILGIFIQMRDKKGSEPKVKE